MFIEAAIIIPHVLLLIEENISYFAEWRRTSHRKEDRLRTGGRAYNTGEERAVAGGQDVNLETVGEVNTGSTIQPVDLAAP